MLITKQTFTEEALRCIEEGKYFDKEYLANTVASSITVKLYDDLGGVNAMSMLDVECFKQAFKTIAMALIDWTRCNRKAFPQEWADSAKDGAWPHPLVGGEL